MYRAFRDLGRVERTLFLLRFISNADVRRTIRAETTKIEAYNDFLDWIAFGGVALTRQRESAKVFAAVETARDIRQLARQIGRAEIKSASIAYATRDELTPAQKARAAEQAREAARATVQQSVKARPGAPARPQQPARSAIARHAAPRSQYPDGRAPEAAAKPIGAERTARPQAPARPAPADMLIPAFEGKGRDGIGRDSLGRGVDDKSVAAVVASDTRVRRELELRSIYLQTAYRDPKAATTRLNELVARDGATSAAAAALDRAVAPGRIAGQGRAVRRRQGPRREAGRHPRGGRDRVQRDAAPQRQ